MMRRTLLVSLVAAVVAAWTPASTAASYTDDTCRAVAVTWTNDPCAGRQWGLSTIEAPQAWSSGARGQGAIVGVVDTGADFNHPDLAANLIAVPGSNMLKNTASRCAFQHVPKKARHSSALAQDDNGHGTHVSGTVAAVTGNATGVAGVAPDARVMPVKVLDSSGSGSDADVARGICFAVDNGAKIVNLSLGYDPASSIIVGPGSDTEAAIAYAYMRGVAVFIAAGNEGFPACDFPASIAAALCVGATDSLDVKAWYSNFGMNIGVVAPGGEGSIFCDDDLDIWSTIRPGPNDCAADGYDTLAGTSMATPHVSGIAALLVSSYGADVTPDFIYDKIRATADDLGPTGLDALYGSGRVNAYRAVSE